VSGTPLARVVWVDSAVQNAQVDASEYPAPLTVTSVGLVADSDDTKIVLARDDMGDGELRGLLAIPMCCVMKTDYLASTKGTE
jgi:hypothetical protein